MDFTLDTDGIGNKKWLTGRIWRELSPENPDNVRKLVMDVDEQMI